MMNAYTYNHSATPCPICHKSLNLHQPFHAVNGLLTCPQCRARLVMSRGGHFVRDPFIGRRSPTGRTLRRQSRPLARILRDAGVTRPRSLTTLVTALGLLALTLLVIGSSTGQFPRLSDKVEPTSKIDKLQSPKRNMIISD